jgi:hypothetical protein
MKIRLKCRDVTRLMLEAEERPLGVMQKVSLHLHWRACAACSRFREQANTMRMALGRWRDYRERDE